MNFQVSNLIKFNTKDQVKLFHQQFIDLLNNRKLKKEKNSTDKDKFKDPNLIFKPELCPKSEAIFKREPSHSKLPTADRLIGAKKMYAEKKEQRTEL